MYTSCSSEKLNWMILVQPGNFLLILRLDETEISLLLYVREGLPSKTLTKYRQNECVENIIVKVNQRTKKWLLSSSYHPHMTFIENNLNHLSKCLDYCSSKYDQKMCEK